MLKSHQHEANPVSAFEDFLEFCFPTKHFPSAAGWIQECVTCGSAGPTDAGSGFCHGRLPERRGTGNISVQ